MAYCTNCGEKLQDNAKFCTDCGSAVPISTIEKSIEKPLEEQEIKADPVANQGGDNNRPGENILNDDDIKHEIDDSTNSNKEYHRTSLNLDESKLESFFNPYPDPHYLDCHCL